MPSIDDLNGAKKTNKIFKKTEYRPWAEVGGETTRSPKDGTPKNSNKFNSESITEKCNTGVGNAELEKTWRRLYGAKRALLGIIIKNIEEDHGDYVVTTAVTANELLSASSLPANTIKTSLQQLKNIPLISNHETKPGRGGFARYKIPKNIYEYLVKKLSLDS